MTSPDTVPSSRKFVLIAMGLTGAVALAITFKLLRGGSAAVPENSASTTQEKAAGPNDILAALPAIADTTAAGKARASALAKVRTAPANAAVWVELGDALAQELRDTANQTFYDHAGAAYREALRLAPATTEAMTGLAWVFGGRHQFDQSIDWANKALELRPDFPDAYGIIGDAELELGRYDDALDHYQKMMDLRPDLSSWSRGAHLLWITGDKSKGMWLMERAIKAGAPYAENTAWCRARLAMMLYHDGALLPAATVLEPALAAGTQNTPLLLAAGRIAAARGEMEAAKKHYQTILETGPNHEALAALGDMAAASGATAEAEKFYTQVEALHASHTATGVHDHMTMAKFFADHDRNLIEALRLAEQAKLTKNVQEADILAWVYHKNGDTKNAVAAMKRALSRNTPDAEMHYHAGLIAAAAGDRTAAQKHLQTALSFNSRFDLLQAPLAVKALEKLTPVPATTAAGEPAVTTVP